MLLHDTGRANSCFAIAHRSEAKCPLRQQHPRHGTAPALSQPAPPPPAGLAPAGAPHPSIPPAPRTGAGANPPGPLPRPPPGSRPWPLRSAPLRSPPPGPRPRWRRPHSNDPGVVGAAMALPRGLRRPAPPWVVAVSWELLGGEGRGRDLVGLKANLERKGCGHRVRPETGIKNRERNKESLCSYSSKPISISLLFF